MLAIDHGRPKTLNLKELINCYIEHRREVVLRRTRFELRKGRGTRRNPRRLLIALANLDEFIRIIRSSQPRGSQDQAAGLRLHPAQVEQLGILIRSEARLVNGRYSFSEAQVNAILELRLYQLTGLEIDKVGPNTRNCSTHQGPAGHPGREEPASGIIKTELLAIKAKYATPRLTESCPTKARSRSRI
jgi:DNA gyrase subunit A